MERVILEPRILIKRSRPSWQGQRLMNIGRSQSLDLLAKMSNGSEIGFRICLKIERCFIIPVGRSGRFFYVWAPNFAERKVRRTPVWPTMRRVIPESHVFRDDLFFPNGQPSQLLKNAITDAVRLLNLRHAFDIEGTQQWYTTIKLQFGFTYRGAKARLAEWLVGLGPPHAVHYLTGDAGFRELASNSFRGLWVTLGQYRQGLLEDSETRQALLKSPWVKEHWIDDLLLRGSSIQD